MIGNSEGLECDLRSLSDWGLEAMLVIGRPRRC